MSRYWFEKRIWGYSPVFWPVTWQGWIFQPFWIWLFVVLAGSWGVTSLAPKRWHDGLEIGIFVAAPIAALAFLVRKTDPGPGWNAGWEREKSFAARHRWASPILFYSGLYGGLQLWMHLKSAAVGMFLVCYYPLFVLSLLYKTVDPTKVKELEPPR